MQQRETKLRLLQRDQQSVYTFPQTATDDGILSQTGAEDVFEEAEGSVGKLLAAVDESIPAVVLNYKKTLHKTARVSDMNMAESGRCLLMMSSART